MNIQLQMPAKGRTNTIDKPAFGGSLQRKCACGNHTIAGSECEECRDKDEALLQRAAVNSDHVQKAPSIVHEVLRSPGQPIDPEIRAFFEPRFGHDFSQVRVHTDAHAAQSAHSVDAHAYTVGQHIVFAEGGFAPSSTAGQRLLAHELCHVVQQSDATHLQRQKASNESTDTQALVSTPSVADQILAIAEQAESAQSGASDPATSAQIAGFVERLRAVAHSDDVNEQMRVLAAFTPRQLTRIDQEASRIKGAGHGTAIQRSPADSGINDPADATEIEATRLADQVVSGNNVKVRNMTMSSVQRQGAEAALAGLIAFEAAGGAEVEAATGPPGWVVGGLVLLAIGGLTILTMARARAGICSCQHRDVFTSGGRSCLDLRTSGVCTGPYTAPGATDQASCQAAARALAPPACRGCLGHCQFKPG